MKRMRANFLTVFLLFMMLTLSPILQFSHGAFGEESEACWPAYQRDRDALSVYSEVLRAYSLPPAWGKLDNLNQRQGEPPTYQTVAKWEVRMGPFVALN